MVIRHGRVIWEGDDTRKVHGTWSLTKTFTSTVLGLLIDEGRCSLETSAADFVSSMRLNYPGVTLRHFATMTSGYRAVGDEPERTSASRHVRRPKRPPAIQREIPRRDRQRDDELCH